MRDKVCKKDRGKKKYIYRERKRDNVKQPFPRVGSNGHLLFITDKFSRTIRSEQLQTPKPSI